jgi:hypothetical protein
METIHVGKTSGEALTGPDPSWRALYRAGGAAAWFYVVFGMLVPEGLFLTSPYDPNMSGAATLAYIASHQASWILVQVLSLGLSIVAMVAFLALLMALKHLNKGYAAIGALIALTSQVLILSYWPITMGQLALSQRYLAASTQAERLALATAAESLNAQNSIAAHSIETLCALGITVLSIVMLRGVFPKVSAYLGLATFPLAVLGEAFAPILGQALLGYLWWAFFLIWLIVVGWTLLRLGSKGTEAKRTESTFRRWLYRGQRANWLARMLNRAWAAVVSSGVASNRYVTLEVTGRTSGRTVSLPVVVAVLDGERYLVSMLGEHVNWVQNVRAAGGKAVLKSSRREEVHLQEVPAEQRAPILKAYLQRAPGAPPCARGQGCPTGGVRTGGCGLSGLPGGFSHEGVANAAKTQLTIHTAEKSCRQCDGIGSLHVAATEPLPELRPGHTYLKGVL